MKPEEFTSAPEEFGSCCPEITPPPAEFSAGAAAPVRRKKKKTLQAAAAALAITVTAVVLLTQPDALPEPEPAPAPVIEEPIPEPDPPAEELMLYEPEPVYENPGGRLIVTVYSDRLIPDVWVNELALEEEFNESDFTQLTLPALEEEGYTHIGYAIAYHSFNGDLEALGYNEGDAPFAAAVGWELDLDEVQLVPVSAQDGVRHVVLHAIWDSGREGTVVLDDGENVRAYSIDSPIDSAGTFYTCAYVPEREGYIFTGWYDANGEKVTYLLNEEMYEEYWNEEFGMLMTDWSKPIDVVLTAGWAKAPDEQTGA